MVSASDRNNGGPGLIHGRIRFVIFGIKTSGRRLTLLNCAVGNVSMYHAYRHASYIKTSTRMSHRPVYPDTMVIICVYLRAKYASPSADIEVQKKNTQESAPPPVRLLDQRWKPCFS